MVGAEHSDRQLSLQWFAWTRFTTPDEVRDRLPALVSSKVSQQRIQNAIDEAEDVLTDDLSDTVFWDEMRKKDVLPRAVRRLARYQAVVQVIVRQWHDDADVLSNEEEPNSPILSWYQERYDKLLGQIRAGSIRILDPDDDEYELDEVKRLGLGRII